MKKWLVKGLIPLGHAVLLLGQPHSVKSWFVEQLAVCVAAGRRFLGSDGFPVTQGSVIIVDEDTPTDTLEERITRLAAAIGVAVADLPIDILSMEGFSLDSGKRMKDLKNLISHLPPPVLVILDCLSGIAGTFDENSSRDALSAASRWNEIKAMGATVIITHHMSLKKAGDSGAFDFTGAAMGSTHLIAKCDTAIGMWRVEPELPTRSIVKAKPRRTALDVTWPFAVELVEPEDRSWVRLELGLELPVRPSRVARAVFPIFQQDEERSLTVNDVIREVDGDFSDRDIRDALHELESHDALTKDTDRGRSHRFRYTINLHVDDDWVPTTEYWEQLQ
jgi:hypothetical protein